MYSRFSRKLKQTTISQPSWTPGRSQGWKKGLKKGAGGLQLQGFSLVWLGGGNARTRTTVCYTRCTKSYEFKLNQASTFEVLYNFVSDFLLAQKRYRS